MDELVIVTARWRHRLADTTAGAVVRAACGGEAGAVFKVVRAAEADALTPLCPVCWPAP